MLRKNDTHPGDESCPSPLAVDRRGFLKTVGAAAAVAGMRPALAWAQAPAPSGPYKLPPLGYAFDALEPAIDARTMEIHHDKHHAAYVTNLNKALDGTTLGNQPVEKLIANLDALPEAIRTAVRNNGGGHANHTLFWELLKKDGGKPSSELAVAIDTQLGGFEKFKEAFAKAATTRFGSGWAWLTLDKNKKLLVESTPNQDTPMMVGATPLLGLDVWEHAYYLKYQNRRPEYIAAFYSVINWSKVNELFSAGMKA